VLGILDAIAVMFLDRGYYGVPQNPANLENFNPTHELVTFERVVFAMEQFIYNTDVPEYEYTYRYLTPTDLKGAQRKQRTYEKLLIWLTIVGYINPLFTDVVHGTAYRGRIYRARYLENYYRGWGAFSAR
jgi:hypothetical protein